MINVIRMLVRWCEAITSILLRFKDVAPQDRVDIRILLVELNDAVKKMEESYTRDRIIR